MMKLLYQSLSLISFAGVQFTLTVRTDGETLFLNMTPPSVTGASVRMTLSYNGQSTEIIDSPFIGYEAEFPYTKQAKNISLSTASAHTTISWQGDSDSPDPSVDVTFGGVRIGDSTNFSFRYLTTGVYCAHIGTDLFHLNNGSWVKEDSRTSKNDAESYSYSFIHPPVAEEIYRFTLTFACYRTADALIDDYIGLATVELPAMVATEAYTPLPPYHVHAQEDGIYMNVSWNAPVDSHYSIDRYSVYRSTDSSYDEVYSGSATSFADRYPAGAEQVQYFIRSCSGQRYSVEVASNIVEVTSPNVFVGIGGTVKQASAIFVGVGGAPRHASRQIIVG